MSESRRDFVRKAVIGAGVLAGAAAGAPASAAAPAPPAPRAHAATGLLPVQTLDIPGLPHTMDGDVKVFHLVAEPVKREFLPGSTFDVWGYNGSVPGPTIQVTEGDRVRLIVDNHLPEATAMHWHGFEIPIDMDGVPGVCQDPIPPGGRFVYEFTLHQNGTFFYHSHMAMQEMMGMIGLFILHPKEPHLPAVDRDFGLILQEWAILPGNTVPNTMAMEFNWLTINGRSGPATTPLIVKLGDRVRLRFVNMGMDHHPMHLHGNTFYVTGTEGGRAPESTWRPENTVLVAVAQARVVEFDAVYPGDWMLHCHLPHHMMNHMASMVGPMMSMGHGLAAGKGMPEGMGMLRQGSALSAENGPSLGRGMGVGTDYDQTVTNMPLAAPPAAGSQPHDMSQMRGRPEVMAGPPLVPGYPQDMFMPMDALVAKPETYGLRKGWSGAVMGMSTLVRVLPPALYEEVRARMRAAGDSGGRRREDA